MAFESIVSSGYYILRSITYNISPPEIVNIVKAWSYSNSKLFVAKKRGPSSVPNGLGAAWGSRISSFVSVMLGDRHREVYRRPRRSYIRLVAFMAWLNWPAEWCGGVSRLSSQDLMMWWPWKHLLQNAWYPRNTTKHSATTPKHTHAHKAKNAYNGEP